MEILTSQTALRTALADLKAVTPRRSSLPVLGHVLISANGHVGFTATDLDIRADLIVSDASTVTDGSVAVPFKALAGLVAKLPKGAAVRLRQVPNAKEDGPQKVEVSWNGATATIMSLPAAEYPSRFDIGGRKVDRRSFVLTGADIRQLARANDFASGEESRPILNGVLWELTREDMRAVATNGHRLARVIVPGKRLEIPKGPMNLAPSFILPPLAVDTAARIFGKAEAVTVTWSAESLTLTGDSGSVVRTRLIDGPYPHYEQVIPKENTRHAVVEVKPFRAAVARMIALASEQTYRIVLAWGMNQVTFSVTTPDLGTVTETLAVAYTDAPLRIGFNGKYLTQMLGAVDSDRARISFHESSNADSRAAVVQPEGGRDFLGLVMPLRLID